MALRQVGFAATTALLHILLIGATTCLCLGLLVVAGLLTVWNGLDFPISWRHAAAFIGFALAGYMAGLGLYRGAQGWFRGA
jgi:hypothetical protein